MKYALIAALAALLTACGGGGNGTPPAPKVNPQAVYPVPLRPCETTGPTAPACPESSAAGAH